MSESELCHPPLVWAKLEQLVSCLLLFFPCKRQTEDFVRPADEKWNAYISKVTLNHDTVGQL